MIFISLMRHFHRHPKICCIYFLFLRKKLIYIGQTTDLRNRMTSHEFNYTYDSIRYIKCRPEKLIEYEKRLIKILKPRCNEIWNRGNPDRKKLPYREPSWARHYDKTLIYRDALATGNHPWTEGILKACLAESEKEFKFYYKLHGFKGTFLDTSHLL